MKTAYFDCFNGASGDMIVGALLAAGADLDRLQQDLEVLALDAVTLSSRRLERQGIHATKFDVRVHGELEPAASHDPGDAPPQPHEAHSHQHEPHAHQHEPHAQQHEPHAQQHEPHAQQHEPHAQQHEPHARAQHHRTLADVEAVLARLPAGPREQAIAIFQRLAVAEAKVHGTTAPFVHFHEVGMDDAIVDVAATVLCLEQLGVSEVQCSPLPLGSGMVRCAHGLMPVPVPAVVELMAGFASYDNGEPGELVTPTGAAILTTLAARFGPVPAWTLEAVGYGAGSREGRQIPNLLRVMVGSPTAAAEPRLLELVANIDDMNPQLYAPILEKLLALGALDVTLTPTHMKKGRPGIVLAALCPEPLLAACSGLIFRETTTLGLRWHAVERQVLGRELREVVTPWGPVAVKLGLLEGQEVNRAPEFDDCLRLATASGRPVKEVWLAALAALGAPTAAD